ncbi:formimidoylglutamase [Polaribacter dokdonensis]|uniref:Formimidoylglutamase n=1 Tax=Polaribacter dokdonensis DSW-5 TaxID=1300348 RepID=A0A0N0CEY6_9FLAO|nr:formimidoylglutamase [Polaribacter dokdonensis]KOY51127.1 Formimidoylglutamase [Polaribacter dokdonensis DSW-5]SEE18142.1 formiminoglutamase [Polaribacter dokdonensis DSW-5]
MDFFKDLNIKYQSTNKRLYSGRESENTNQYWHEKITFSDITAIENSTKKQFGILGYACDEGVKRNQGRVGAKKGPEFIRQKLGKLPIHFTHKKVTDFGDITCIDENLEDCQAAFSKSISHLITHNIFPIGIGGGHDIAYATFNGIKGALTNDQKNKIGIINFDAHFDLRVIDRQPNSGTPFNQILSENDNVVYFPVGIQQQSNTKELFEIAKQKNISFLTNFDCETFSDNVKCNLNSVLEKVNHLYITIDLDGFSSAFAPGVSAASPLGLSPNFIYQALTFLLKSNKVIACDITELNPKYDKDNITAQLAAKLVDYIVLQA